MSQYLPPNLLAMFAPRDPLEFKPPPEKRKMPSYTGLAAYLSFFEDPKAPRPEDPAKRVESREERRERKRREHAAANSAKIAASLQQWDPAKNPDSTSDAYKTLFVARMDYKTDEEKLKREFEPFGPIKKIHIVRDVTTGTSRGYAFIEFERDRDMHNAYKSANGKKIDDKRVLVDIERGRTVRGWLPRRFGGGLGHARADRKVIQKLEETREKERQKERERERERDRDRGERDRDTDRDKDRDRDREHRDRDRERDRRDRDRDRDRRGEDRERERSDRRRSEASGKTEKAVLVERDHERPDHRYDPYRK